MSTYQQLTAILAGGALTTALVISYAHPAQAKTGKEVNDIAREVTVLIRGERGHGSGVIIHKTGNVYYVLTANHVVRKQDSYKLVTADKQAYGIEYGKIKRMNGIDLAIVKFTSDKNYPVAKIAPVRTSEGQDVFVSGWPTNGAVGNAAGGELIRQFTSGSISGFLPKDLNGYSTIYTNVTRAGMSGGPVFDAGGRLIAIHGMGDKEDATALAESGLTQEVAIGLAAKIKPGFNYGIPIDTFLKKSDTVGIDGDILAIEKTPAPEVGAPYVTSKETDPRDKIDNIQATLKTVKNVTDTVDNVTDGVNDTRRTIDSFRRSIGF
jgi:serine protease Do